MTVVKAILMIADKQVYLKVTEELVVYYQLHYLGEQGGDCCRPIVGGACTVTLFGLRVDKGNLLRRRIFSGGESLDAFRVRVQE